MKTRYLVDSLARPVNVDLYQVFRITAAEDCLSLRYTFVSGSGASKLGSEYDGSIVLIERLLVAYPPLVQAVLKIRQNQFALFGQVTTDLESQVACIIDQLREKGVYFILLRGSEVSLDRLVQLEDSSPSSPFE
jgi:hypothetical protein